MLLCLNFKNLYEAVCFKNQLKNNLRKNGKGISFLGEVKVSIKFLKRDNLVFLYVKGNDFPFYMLGFLLGLVNLMFWQSVALYVVAGFVFGLILFWTPLPYFIGSKLLIKKLGLKEGVRFLGSERAIIAEMREDGAD